MSHASSLQPVSCGETEGDCLQLRCSGNREGQRRACNGQNSFFYAWKTCQLNGKRTENPNMGKLDM